MKKIAVLLLAVCSLFCMTSCVDSEQLKEIAVVQAIGIDYDKDEFQLTLQIYSPKSAGGTSSIDTSKNNATIITTSGTTIADAMRNATLLQGKTIFSGHNRVIVLGRDLSEQGIRQIFSYFNRDARTKQNADVMMASTTANEIVTTNIEQGMLAAETMENMVNNYKRNGLVYDSPYYLLSQSMNVYDGCAAMPIIAMDEAEQEQAGQSDGNEENGSEAPEQIQTVNKLKLTGTAVFRDYKLVNTMDENQTRGLLLLDNQLKQSVIVAEEERLGKASVGIYNSNSSLKPVFGEDGSITFLLKAHLRASLDEVLLPQQEYLTEQAIKNLERSCETILAEEAVSAFQTAVNNSQSDILYLKDSILKSDRSVWNRVTGSFTEALPKMQIKTDITVTIDRMGLETDEKL